MVTKTKTRTKTQSKTTATSKAPAKKAAAIPAKKATAIPAKKATAIPAKKAAAKKTATPAKNTVGQTNTNTLGIAQKSSSMINKNTPAEQGIIPSTTRKTTRTKTTATLIVKRSTPSYEQIAERAYSLFQVRGYQHGYDVEDWMQAEKDLSSIK